MSSRFSCSLFAGPLAGTVQSGILDFACAYTNFDGWGQPSHFGGGGIFDQIRKPAR